MRCVTPSNHWEANAWAGRLVEHDENGVIWVEKGPHAAALMKAGYVVAET